MLMTVLAGPYSVKWDSHCWNENDYNWMVGSGKLIHSVNHQ